MNVAEINKKHTTLDEYVINTYRPEFKEEIIELQKYLWGPDLSKNLAYFEWKHEQNPYQDNKPMVYLCRHNGRVIGMTGYIGAVWQVGSPPQLISIPCGGDSVVHPDYRNLGLFKQLNEFALVDINNRGYEFVLGLGAAQIINFSVLKMGWHSAGEITQYYFTPKTVRTTSGLNKFPVLPKLYRGIKRILTSRSTRSSLSLNVFSDLDNMSANLDNNREKYISVSHASKPEEMADLVERIGFDGRIRHLRDQIFFSWRFKNPRSEYRFLFWENDRLEGYLVLQRKFKSEYSGVTIVDWEYSSPQVQEDLLHAAIAWGKFDALHIWTVSLNDHTKRLLAKYGFILDESGYKTSVLVRKLSDEVGGVDSTLINRKLTEISNWDLRAIYSDGY